MLFYIKTNFFRYFGYLIEFFTIMKQLFAIFITRQLTGNIKESLIPYVKSSMNQIKIIDKTKNSNLALEKNQELIKNINKLKQYSINYRNFHKFVTESTTNRENTDIKETSNDPLENLSQPEVESLMPKVFTN